MAGPWVVALDGGGTKTALALASRQGEVVLLPEGPGCNPQDGGPWETTLTDLLGRATRAEGGLVAAVLGVPGRGEVPVHDEAVDALLARLLPCPFEAMNDVALAHLGAFGGGEGVLLLAGTGSMAWARGPEGEARVGGWGDAFGDEGSAHWIGREALALASRVLDGRTLVDPAPATGGRDGSGRIRDPSGPETFVEALRARLGPDAAGSFGPLAWLMARGGSRSAMAQVARHVDALAEEGHQGARDILHQAALMLTDLAWAAAHRTGLPPPFAWVASGSAFRSARLRAVASQVLGAPAPSRLSTLGGGLLRAATLAGWSPSDAWAAQVDARFPPAP